MSAAENARAEITDQNAAMVYAVLAVAESVDRLTVALTEVTEPRVLTVDLDGADVDVVDLAARIEDALGNGAVPNLVAGPPRGRGPAAVSLCSWCDHSFARHLPISGVCGVNNCGCSQAES